MLFLLFGQSVEDTSQGDKTPLEECPPKTRKVDWVELRECVLRAGASRPAASSSHHRSPRGLGDSGARGPGVALPASTGSLELTASAVRSEAAPPSRGSARLQGPRFAGPRRGGGSGRREPGDPQPPGKTCRLPPRARGPEAHGRPPQRRKLLHLLFVSLRVWRGSGTAQDPDLDTDFPPPGDAASLAPRSRPAFRRTKFSTGSKSVP